MKILIADDDERIVRMLSDYFKFNGFETICSYDGYDVLEKFNSNEIDMVLLDIMMPVYDGWIVCKEIRKISQVPIVMLTAKDSDLDELFAFDIGVDDYISKPFNISLLMARINSLLKHNISQNSNNKFLKYKIWETVAFSKSSIAFFTIIFLASFNSFLSRYK